MTGVFISSAAVDAILGSGGADAYLKSKFNDVRDCYVIRNDLNHNDNFNVVRQLILYRNQEERNSLGWNIINYIILNLFRISMNL